MLVGTYGAGLETLDSQGRFTPIELPSGTPRDLVINPNALYATSSHIYAGTLGNGMLIYSISSGRWSAVTTGLPSLNVTAFAARAGEIYVGTENGLVRIPRRISHEDFCLLLAVPCCSIAARADSGTLTPRDKQAPDPSILSLDEMRVDIASTTATPMSPSFRSSPTTPATSKREPTASRFQAAPQSPTSLSGMGRCASRP
jgi:hypothetical protein